MVQKRVTNYYIIFLNFIIIETKSQEKMIDKSNASVNGREMRLRSFPHRSPFLCWQILSLQRGSTSGSGEGMKPGVLTPQMLLRSMEIAHFPAIPLPFTDPLLIKKAVM